MKRTFTATIVTAVRHIGTRRPQLRATVREETLEATSIFSARKLALARFGDASSVTLEAAPTGILAKAAP